MCFDKIALIFVTVLTGELTRRLFQVAHEYVFYRNFYLPEQRFIQIFRCAFHFTVPSVIISIVGVILTLIYGLTTHQSFIQNLKSYLYVIPIYWIYCGVRFHHNAFEYSQFIRENNGLNYADGMASNYFHGYLKFMCGINERIENYSDRHKVEFASKRLIILVSDTMYVHAKIKSNILEKVTPLEPIIRNRAGVLRPYQNDVYRFTKPVKGKFLYVAVEGATPLVSFFESLHFRFTATWQMKTMQREIFLKFSKYLKKILKDWPETEDQFEIILYKAYDDNGNPIDVGEMLFEYLENKIH